MKEWPANNKTAMFSDIVNPLAEILRSEKIDSTNVYNIGETERACVFETDYTLSPEGLAYHKERGRDLIDVICALAVQLGIEQGRRMQAHKREIWVSIAKRAVSSGNSEDMKFALEGLLRYE